MISIEYKRAETDKELREILDLQQENHLSAVNDTEKQKEGFVTVKHSFDILKKMNDECPHIIACYNNKVVGYALCMSPVFKDQIPILKPMFKQIDSLVTTQSYIVMGQICIDKAFRKKGIFKGLYTFMQKELRDSYKMVITEVDTENTRSLNAHYAVGFKLLKKYSSGGQNWDLIAWYFK